MTKESKELPNKSSPRRRGREAALQMLYEGDYNRAELAVAFERYWHDLARNTEGKQFAQALLAGLEDNRAAIDEAISAASTNWRLERMGPVDRGILRIGTYELLFRDDIPLRVTLNETVELAKRYGNEESPGFVNGVLDRVARAHGMLPTDAPDAAEQVHDSSQRAKLDASQTPED